MRYTALAVTLALTGSALCLKDEALASPSMVSTLIGVQPGSAWTQFNPPPHAQCPEGGNPHMDGVFDITTPAGPGIETRASGGTLQCCEIAYAERLFALGGLRRSTGSSISFFYNTGVTGAYATTGYTLTFMLGNTVVGQRRYLGETGSNGVDGVGHDEVSPVNQVVTVYPDSFLGNVIFDNITVRLNHYGCEMTAFQDFSDMTLNAEVASASELIRDLIALVAALPDGTAHKGGMLHDLDGLLRGALRGESLAANGVFESAGNILVAVSKRFVRFENLLMAANLPPDQLGPIMTAEVEAKGAAKEEGVNDFRSDARKRLKTDFDDAKKSIQDTFADNPTVRDARLTALDQAAADAGKFLNTYGRTDVKVDFLVTSTEDIFNSLSSKWTGKFDLTFANETKPNFFEMDGKLFNASFQIGFTFTPDGQSVTFRKKNSTDGSDSTCADTGIAIVSPSTVTGNTLSGQIAVTIPQQGCDPGDLVRIVLTIKATVDGQEISCTNVLVIAKKN